MAAAAVCGSGSFLSLNSLSKSFSCSSPPSSPVVFSSSPLFLTSRQRQQQQQHQPALVSRALQSPRLFPVLSLSKCLSDRLRADTGGQRGGNGAQSLWKNPSRRRSPRRFQVVASVVGINTAAPNVLVNTLLSLVEGTDRGTKIGKQEEAMVNEIVARLEKECIPKPLESPLSFGEFEVAYSSNPTAPGGYYRSLLGRALLKTRDMVQTISAPDGVHNEVAFAAFGFIDGRVSLQGKLKALDDKWVEVTFNAPTVELGPFRTQYGGNSSVKLAVIYLDNVVRIGRGSRGSLFIFKRRN
ncbi:unnamed protein product [Sphagnum tenellum]